MFFLTPATSREKNGSHRSKKQTGVSFLGIQSKRSIKDVEAMTEVATTACNIARKKNWSKNYSVQRHVQEQQQGNRYPGEKAAGKL